MAGPGIELGTSGPLVRHATDCATRPGSMCVCVYVCTYTIMSQVEDSTLKKSWPFFQGGGGKN